MKKLLLLLACLLTLASASEAAAKGVAGRLDPSFGRGGKVMLAFPAQSAGNVGVRYELPFQFSPGHIEMALAPGGKIVVAGSTRIARLLANGKPDRSFGTAGVAAVPAPAGMTFVLAGLAVDSQGRVLLAGSARPLPSSSTPDPLASSAAVMRFAADGSLDTGFGSGGTLVTDLGIEAPEVPSGHYPSAAVGVHSIVVDSQDRPLVTGGSVAKVCYNDKTEANGFVARLTTTGALDTGFAAGGLRQISEVTSFAQAQLTRANALFAVGSSRGSKNCSNEADGSTILFTRLTEAGNPDPGFGFSGFRSVGFKQAPVATVLPSGKIGLLAPRQKRSQVVLRLLPNGAPDPSFGRTGSINVRLPKGVSLAAIGADRQGRMLLAGRASRRISKSRRNTLRRSTFTLGRMHADGTFDRSFGRRASTGTGFGARSSSFATQVMVDARGRILVGGGITTARLGTGGGFAIARFRG